MAGAAIDLIDSTVQLEQSIGEGRRIVGTGFLLSASNADGSPRTILITANHVFDDMKASEAKIGFRSSADGVWTYTPATLAIRNEAGDPLWTRHPERDVAAISVKAPPEFARAAIPINYLAADEDSARSVLAPGGELFVLGYPRGLAANDAGFPILRSGRIASYPASPTLYPTFLLDFSVFPGNSGGPVFAAPGLQPASAGARRPFIAGILTQQVEVENERLEIGIVTHAKYIAETVDLLYGGQRPPPPKWTEAQSQVSEAAVARPVAHREAPPSVSERIAASIRRRLAPLALVTGRILRGLSDQVLAWARHDEPQVAEARDRRPAGSESEDRFRV